VSDSRGCQSAQVPAREATSGQFGTGHGRPSGGSISSASLIRSQPTSESQALLQQRASAQRPLYCFLRPCFLRHQPHPRHRFALSEDP